MSTAATARKIYRATKDVPSAVASIRAEFAALALEFGTDPQVGFQLTSSTVNGQTFSGTWTSDKEERLAMLGQVVWSYDNCQQLPSSTRILF